MARSQAECMILLRNQLYIRQKAPASERRITWLKYLMRPCALSTARLQPQTVWWARHDIHGMKYDERYMFTKVDGRWGQMACNSETTRQNFTIRRVIPLRPRQWNPPHRPCPYPCHPCRSLLHLHPLRFRQPPPHAASSLLHPEHPSFSSPPL